MALSFCSVCGPSKWGKSKAEWLRYPPACWKLPSHTFSYLAFSLEKVAGKPEDDLGIQAERSDLQQTGRFPRSAGRLRCFLKSHSFKLGGREEVKGDN